MRSTPWRYGFPTALLCAALLMAGMDASARPFGRIQGNDGAAAACDQDVPAITSGYGAEGPYRVALRSLENPAFARKPVQVFLPEGAQGRRPVIFFSHGYGPGRWETYKVLIDHMVSVGDIVVFSSYPALRAGNDERYDDLWAGFKAAAEAYGDRMDLTRVGFVGHSFGGGATPAMAYRGIVQQGWGRQGAFLMELAPWYSFQISDAQLQQFPENTLQLLEVFDRDDTNDHRMAVDLYTHSRVSQQYFFLVHSADIRGCQLVADHGTPGSNPSLRQKQYAVLRPFDALADDAFNGSAGGRTELLSLGTGDAAAPYQPLSLENPPAPVQPEIYYKHPWSSVTNPRRQESASP